MKITCSSCGSKYTIANAKVQGKKVKVRCKSCKESIVVDGTQLTGESSDDDSDVDTNSMPEASIPPAPGASGAGELWSVNLSDDDSREMTVPQLVQGWRDGTVTSDAYVWKDGMGDWKPILDVSELSVQLNSQAGSPVHTSSANKGAAKAKVTGDLFGAMDTALAQPAMGTAAGKPVDAKATGARNDSSVLFSLDSLNSPLAGGGHTSSAVNIFGDMGTAPTSLTTDTDLLMAPPKEPPPAPIGARSVGAFPTATPKKSNKSMIIGAAIVGLLALGGIAIAVSGGSTAKKEQTAAVETEHKAAEEAEEAKAKVEEENRKLEAEREKMKAELEKAKKQTAALIEKKDDKAEADAKKKAEEEKAEAAAKQASAESSAASHATSSPSSAPAKSSGPGPFSINAAKSALTSAAASAASCKKPGGPTGSGKVQVTFSTSGRVTSANVVSGPFGGTSVGGCVASTFRRARVPAFSGSPTTVSKSFAIH